MSKLVFILALVTVFTVVKAEDGNQAAVTQSINEFSIQFLKKLKYDKETIFFSPLSIVTALGMTLKGARGSTNEEILKALQIENGTKEESVHKALNKILNAEESRLRSDLTFEVANMAALQNSFPFEKSYSDFIKTNYHALAKSVDFANAGQAAIDEINGFANNKTHGLIKKIFEKPLGPSTVFALVNTVYFKGLFRRPFEAMDEYSFENFDKTTSQVPMMNCKGFISLTQTGELSLVEIPYHGDVSLYLIVPTNRDGGLKSILDNLTEGQFSNLTRALVQKPTFLMMPKFQYEYSPDLKEVLQKLGAQSMFIQGTANLSGISKASTYISQVVHKARILMNEKGTEAAAVTGMAWVRKSGFRAVRLVIDHPFAYIIRHKIHNVNLFVGVVNKL